MSNTIITPIGADHLTSALSGICVNKLAHKRCGLPVPHFVIPLDSGNGQTTILRYIADILKNNDVRHFGGLDHYLEYNLDGSLGNLKQMFADIESSAVYTNSYEGVIGINICALASNINEQGAYFVEKIAQVGNTATLVLFIGNNPTKGALTLVDSIKKVVPSLVSINIDPYSTEQLCEIAMLQLEERGVILDDSPELTETFKNIISKNSCKTVRDLTPIVNDAIRTADFSGFLPKVSANTLILEKEI